MQGSVAGGCAAILNPILVPLLAQVGATKCVTASFT